MRLFPCDSHSGAATLTSALQHLHGQLANCWASRRGKSPNNSGDSISGQTLTLSEDCLLRAELFAEMMTEHLKMFQLNLLFCWFTISKMSQFEGLFAEISKCNITPSRIIREVKTPSRATNRGVAHTPQPWERETLTLFLFLVRSEREQCDWLESGGQKFEMTIILRNAGGVGGAGQQQLVILGLRGKGIALLLLAYQASVSPALHLHPPPPPPSPSPAGLHRASSRPPSLASCFKLNSPHYTTHLLELTVLLNYQLTLYISLVNIVRTTLLDPHPAPADLVWTHENLLVITRTVCCKMEPSSLKLIFNCKHSLSSLHWILSLVL